MNLLILIAVFVVGFLALWAGQLITQKFLGQPLTAPLRYNRDSIPMRWAGKLLVQGYWIALLFGFPLLIGETFLTYFGRAFSGGLVNQALILFCVAYGVMIVGYLFEIVVGWVEYKPWYDASTRRKKLLRRFLTPLPLALMEEAVFRGLVLEQIYQVGPQNLWGATIAIALSAAAFSAVHFIKRHSNTVSQWQAGIGLFVVGSVLGIAYFAGGRTLWFPVAVHAAGILVTESMRLYTEYKGPQVLIGYPSFPHSGLVGLTSLTILSGVVIQYFAV